MLLEFCGSDWCGWSMKLNKEVLSQGEFKKFAKDNLVCVQLDFPKKKQLSKKQQEQNAKLAEKYKVKGYPTVIVLSPQGELVAQTGYQEGGATKYVEYLKGVIDKHKGKVSATQAESK